MPKKGRKSNNKKGAAGKKKKKKSPKKNPKDATLTPIPQKDTSSEAVTLRKTLREMKTDLQNERKHSEEFQQNKSKIELLWQNEKTNLSQIEETLRGKLIQKQELEMEHQRLKQISIQKSNNLRFEQQTAALNARIASELSLSSIQDKNRLDEQLLSSEYQTLKISSKQREMQHLELANNLKNQHENEVMILRKEFQRKAEEMKKLIDGNAGAIEKEFAIRKSLDLKRIETLKGSQTDHLISQHKEAFLDIKAYYQVIIQQNLELIKRLKSEMSELQKSERLAGKKMLEIVKENKELSQPFQKYSEDIKRLKEQLIQYQKIKQSLKSTDSKIKLFDQKITDQNLKLEFLEQKFAKDFEEKEILQTKLEEAVFEIQQKTEFQNLVLEKKLEVIRGDLEKKETALHEILVKMHPEVVGDVSKKLEDVLFAKNRTIQQCEEHLAVLKKRCGKTVKNYESLLAKYELPLTELQLPIDIRSAT